MQIRCWHPLFLLGFLLWFHPSLSASDLAEVRIPFYSDQISIFYPREMVIKDPGRLDERHFKSAYQNLSRNGTDILLANLLSERQRLRLNDYLFFQLVQNTVRFIYREKRPFAQKLTIFYLLSRAGFDTRLTYRDDRLYVNVFTDEDLFEVPIISDGGRAYANISCMDATCLGRQSLFLAELRPNPKGRSFSFKLREWPLLPAVPRPRILRFPFRDQIYQLTVNFDQTVVDIMEDYPLINEYCYLDSPLSATLQASLLPRLRQVTEYMDQRTALEFLVSFTRSAFQYQEDTKYFGRSKPMVPEELFGYTFSDCEDRSALFYALVRDLLGLPMAVVAYEDHLTVAVSGGDLIGEGFSYQGQRYVFCDPTGPAQSSEIGKIPPGYEQQHFQVIGTF